MADRLRKIVQHLRQTKFPGIEYDASQVEGNKKKMKECFYYLRVFNVCGTFIYMTRGARVMDAWLLNMRGSGEIRRVGQPKLGNHRKNRSLVAAGDYYVL